MRERGDVRDVIERIIGILFGWFCGLVGRVRRWLRGQVLSRLGSLMLAVVVRVDQWWFSSSHERVGEVVGKSY